MDNYQEWTDEQLYRFINDQASRENAFNRLTLGLDEFKKHPLVSEVRSRCEKNLWFLGKYFLFDTDPHSLGKTIEDSFFYEHVHRRVCDMFITKDKSKPIGQQDWRKDRLILYPRGTGKSAWDRYDVVQWILNFPDIRILYLTATKPLATGFVGETKGHFVINDKVPTLMNLYFPEYCFRDKDSGTENELTCPCALWVKAKIKRKEPTVVGGSIDTTLSGGHYEVMKVDDSVSDENSNNETQCKAVTASYNLKHKMLVPTGYADKIGTRYADEDMYGEDLKRNVGTNIVRQEGTNWEIIDNNDLGLRILIGRSIVIKPEVREKLEKENRPITYAEAGEDGCTLLFPEIHPYNWCMYEYGKNEVIFEGQQNQNPRSSVNPVFDRVLMMKHTIPFNDKIVPQSGPVSVFWDFGFSTAKGRDYSTGSAAIWNPQRQCIFIDLIRAKFKPLDLAKAVVEFARKHRPYIIGIEKSASSDFIHPAIMQEAWKTKDQFIIDVCGKIDWVKPSNQKDAKKTRMRALHPWIAGDMMYFLNTIPYRDVMYEEFERCLGDHHHDDIPDNFGYQPRYAPSMMQAILQQETDRFSRADGAWNYLFDSSGELYGDSSPQQWFSPFQGLRLENDPDNPGVLRWVSEQPQNPLVNMVKEEDIVPSSDTGLDPVTGTL